MVKVERGDGVSILKIISAKSIDVVFLDPPDMYMSEARPVM